ncbi:SDR family NAD(P)-dependent oxidoreductase [Pseudidiomarina sp.]|uniref:SDR family NAD(P)-dependent oxidoreductase n=1 Tax=Pseudidiomarina sp. TaxID=2081707 RepID=UPI00299DBA00|nr:SDR family NAD(P)-dependent oxidoreductase [Pseudidiomarina sp.]MDX1706016.1 SDR family NAD(P)-dependent oxidoreductase [Pseudidiomarina sp.]
MIVVFGGGGGLGQALIAALLKRGETVLAVSRQPKPAVTQAKWLQVDGYESDQLHGLKDQLEGQQISGVISALGILHSNEFMPEKRLDEVNKDQLNGSFYVNAVLPILLLQTTLPLLPVKQRCFWVQLSAKVGSITDNYLGGWYSYRASKAALNMLLKTASVETARTHKQLIIAAIHPGTTDTSLSQPFQQRLPKGKLFAPEVSAERILAVTDQLTVEQSGQLLHWDGSRLPY